MSAKPLPRKRNETADEVAALARGLTLLRVVSEHGQPLGQGDLARLTGIPRATVSRLVGTLVSHRFLRQLPNSEVYELAPATLDLGNAFLRHFDLRTAIRPWLKELAEFAGAAVHLAVRDRFDMVLIDTVRPDSGMIFSRLDVGARLNICTSAIGRAYLFRLPESERNALLQSARIAAADEWARISHGVDQALEEAKTTGVCLSLGEWHPLVNSVAVAFQGPGGRHYAFNCGGPAFVLDRSKLIDHIAPRMLECLQAIESEFGNQGLDGK